MNEPVLICAFCHQPITRTNRSQVAIKVLGWALPRSAGGVNTIALKEELGQFAHVTCVKLEMSKRPHQPSLLD